MPNMLHTTNSPLKLKKKSLGQDGVVNAKTSVTCSNVPEALFDPSAAKKHFSKFGHVQRIRLQPKRQMCVIEYDQPSSAERAVLNAGAYDGFMFDVSRYKARVRRHSKRDDDPDWIPDPSVEAELSAMGETPTYRLTRQKVMDVDSETPLPKLSPGVVKKQSPLKKKVSAKVERRTASQPVSGTASPVPMASTQTSLTTSEAAMELFQLRSKISTTPDEQWRILDARDRILRGWGGAGSRVHAGGATVGTCRDMCPEKELLHRRAEHQVMTLETVVDSDGVLDPRRAVKQYSRSSADQEIPMCYELRPASVLMRTCAYLLHEIADTDRPVSLADWFHFMWDRLRSIRKDITQQALCCAVSIRLVETCARFHAHCAARLADLEHTQFDQRLNTDNLTKCLQTLKHMYADVTPEHKPRESEFRGYVALLNLGDANFWWEIKQLPIEIQKSKDIIFAIKIFNALDNNNYVRFFRLVQDEATYLQACILLRYFNDVRARALARIVKAYAPRGGSRYPAEDMMRALAFESLESLNCFINHYGLRFSRSDDVELSIILDRNQFIEDSDPYPIARAISLIESKRNSSVGEIIAGGELPQYKEQVIFTSFTKDGKLKESALTAEDQGYNTTNDSNKDINSLKAEIQKLCQGGKIHGNIERPTEDKVLEYKGSLFVKNKPKLPFAIPDSDETDSFSFTPALVVAPTEIIKNTSEKILKDAKSVFSFSPPQETVEGNLFVKASSKSIFETKVATDAKNIFGTISNNNQSPHTHSLFGNMKPDENLLKKPEVKSVFGQPCEKPTNVFGVAQNKNIFANRNENTNIQTSTGGKNIFGAKSDSLFSRNTVTFEKGSNIFGKPIAKSNSEDAKRPSNIFGTFAKASITNNLFSKSGTTERQITAQSIFSNGGTAPNKLSPGTLFKSAVNAPSGEDSKSYSIFHSKNKAQTVADNILNSVNAQSTSVYEFNQNADAQKESLSERLKDERMKEEKRMIQEKIKREEQERREELRRKEEARKKEEEMKILEERRKKEEQRKQEELKKKLEEARKAELKRKAEEEKKFKERVNKESVELIEELVNELGEETVINLIKEERERFENLMKYGSYITDNILEDVCNEICELEMKAEKFRTEKLLKKWFHVWRKQYITNKKKRNLLEDTPVWLTENTPLEEANHMRRAVENFALKNMNAIHRGYKFIGELKQLPAPNPYNIMEIIRSPLLKRMKQINYPYDKCFFWKVTLISPGSTKWLYKKINIEKWLLDAFGDKNDHEASRTLIHVGKQSWNHLMDFAISVSLASEDKPHDHAESIEGTNGVLFYMIDNDVTKTIEDILKHKYPNQVIPVAVLIPNSDINAKIRTECGLRELVEKNVISTFKIFIVNSENVSESLNASTKRAMKWIAKNYPPVPPLEIDYLKSICQRYLGNEIWCMLRSNRDERMSKVLKDLHKLIKCYNFAVDKLTVVITNERLFNYASFPLEFQKYLDSTSPYPKPYEFIPSNVKTSENISAIKHIMERLKLPDPSSEFNPIIAVNMQQQMRIYCNQIGWLDDPENVVSKVISVIPKESSDLSMPREDFSKYLAHYDLIEFLNIVVYEMINKLNNFDNRLAIYQKSVLADYRTMPWLYEISVINEMKHKATDHKDAIDFYIESKRRKTEVESLEYLMLEDKDFKLVDESIQEIDGSISKYNDCAEAVKQLELKLEEGKKKSLEFENLLKTALADFY